MVNQITFNCGEFLPGKKQISLPRIAPIVPPGYIPVPTRPPIYYGPGIRIKWGWPWPLIPKRPIPEKPNPVAVPGIPIGPITPDPSGIPVQPSSIFFPGDPPDPLKPKGPFTQGRNQIIVNLETAVVGVNQSQNSSLGNSIYHPYYNIFSYSPGYSIEYKNNTKYLNIFKDVVASEVAYILNMIGTTKAWSEVPYTQLTIQKIEVSIIPKLLSAFESITNVNQVLVSKNDFLIAVHNHLITNSLDSFDPEYFIYLARKQKDDPIVIYKPSMNLNNKEVIGLNILETESIPVDPNNNKEEQALQLLRGKVLNEDIEAIISYSDLSSITYPTSIMNAGLYTVEGDIEGYISLGEGDGYYISSLLVGGEYVPLEISTQLSSSYYPPVGTRETVLELFNFTKGLRLTVSSVSGQSEFDLDYNLSDSLSASYFMLDLSSVGENVTNNPFIYSTSGNYKLLSNLEEINEHARTYGFSVSRVNIDIHDPFLQYAIDSGNIEFKQNDITFRQCSPARTNKGDIYVRAIPFGIVLVPGRGTKHNPFFGNSIIESFDHPVIRTIDVISDINKSIKEQYKTGLEEQYLGDTGKYSLGLLGKADTQNKIYQFNPESGDFQNTYYSGGYSSNSPVKERSILGKLNKDIIEDILLQKYDLENITWWDLFRRLSADQMASLAIQGNDTYWQKLAEGWKGFTIRPVLNKLISEETGISVDLNSIIEDPIILQEEDRINAKSY